MNFPVWKAIFQFEIRYHVRQPLVYVTGLGLFLLALMFASTGMATDIPGLPGSVNRNAPFVLLRLMAGLTAFGLFVITAFVSSSALRDFRLGSHMLFFSKPVGKLEYLTGRFAGSMVISMALLVMGILGVAAGVHAPWHEADRVGPFDPAVYLYGLFVIVVPNVLMMGGIFFAISSLSRSLMASYIAVVLFVVLQDEAEILVRSVEHGMLGSLIEPLAIVAMGHAARYWSVAEYNSLLPGLGWGIIGNRLLWLGLGAALFTWCYQRFSYSRASAGGLRTRRRTEKTRPAPPALSIPATIPAAPTRRGSFGAAWRQTLRQARLEARIIIHSVPFIIFLVLGVTFILFFAGNVAEVRGTPVHPVTHLMARSIDLAMGLFLMIVVTVYGGEAVWRERGWRMNQILDAMPVSSGVYVTGKLLALTAVVTLFLLAGVLTTIGYQLGHGFFDVRPGLYFTRLLIAAWPYVLAAFLALFLQTLVNNKFLGYLLTILVILSRPGLPMLGVEHNLLRFPAHLGMPYSDMNGYGHHLKPYIWFKIYWSFAALLMAVLSVLLAVRGTDSSLRARIAAARARFSGPIRIAALAGLAGFISTGAFIFYNTNVLNGYLPRGEAERLQAEYEERYGRHRDLKQPRVTEVLADVEIFPADRRLEIHGRYTLRNRSAEVISSLHITLNPKVGIRSLTAGRSSLAETDPEHGHHVIELQEPLSPQDSVEFEFDLEVRNPGFVNHDPDRKIVANGTFFTTGDYFPAIGYDEGVQLTDPALRRKHGLPQAPRMAALDDEEARSDNYIAANSDWVQFETTVSTREDQIAIAPGYLQREWTEDGRRYFHYKMDAPVLGFFSYSSADYVVARDRWKDVDIEIYYDAHHGYNVERMIDAVKKSLDYYTSHFGPYQHRQVRILEFPAYAAYAQAFPNTIPVSESAGFIARLVSDDDFDYVFNTTAHEVAHQWWAHQVIGAGAQGATLLSESLAEYSSLMVMEKEYGPERMRRALRYELDAYLRGRGRESDREMPLMLVENQKYIHYNKGSLVFYALRDYIGEKALNRALARYLRDFAFSGPPYSSSRDLLEYLRRETPPELEYLLEDMFETITLYANRAVSASATPHGDGSWIVSLSVEARKLRADGVGVETEIPMNDWIDIGVFDEDGNPLLLEKQRVSGPEMQFEFSVGGRPAQAGIDPYHKLIDREPEDNVLNVRLVAAAG